MLKLQGLHFTMENDTQPNCFTFSEDWYQQQLLVGFWIEGVAVSVVAILGILGNMLAMTVFTRKKMRNSFNLLLVALACFDAMYLFGAIFGAIFGAMGHFGLSTDTHTILYPYFLYPLQSIVFSASIFMIVSIAIERYTVVCQPQKYAEAMLEKHAVAKRLLKYVGAVTILALVLSVNKFFEVKLVMIEDIKFIGITELRSHPTYSKVSQWTSVILTGVIPFVLLICLYTKIVLEVKNRKMSHAEEIGESEEGGETVAFQMTEMSTAEQLPPCTSRIAKNHIKEEDKLAMIFLAIVIVFFICHLPRLILSIHETFMIDDFLECSKAGKTPFGMWRFMLVYISHLFIVISSAINFPIYTCLSPKFRQECRKLLKCC